MTPLSLFSLTLASLCLTSVVSAQKPGGTGKAKIELKGDDADPKADPNLKLDPTGKLPAANKGEAFAPLDTSPAKTAELPAALKKLPPDQLQKYAAIREEATGFMRSVRQQESLEKIAEAERLVGEPVAELENLRGAIYTKMRDFANARAHFEKAVSLDKNSFHPHFNLAELDFVEKKFPSAITAFTALVAENDDMKKHALVGIKEDERVNTERQFDSTKRLIEFKLFICQLQEKNQSEADKILKNFNSYDNDSPAYYFAKAVQAFIKDKKDSAEEWVASAKNIYPATITEVYVDSLVEMGWMTTLAQ
jgi:tetratricopeptide (TPR) repeat protein